MNHQPPPAMTSRPPGSTSPRLWPCLAGQAPSAGQAPTGLAERLGRLTSPALADHVFPGLVDPAIAREARLLNRFRRAAGVAWARRLDQAGIPVVCLKGLGTAYLAYRDPDLRGLSDADLLIRPADLDRALELLEGDGFRFAEAQTRSPWGFVGEASFQPLMSRDGGTNLDLHIQPDAWPLPLGLDGGAVFRAARRIETETGAITVPAAEHAFLIAVSHAARDLFGQAAIKGLIDAARLVAGAQGALDWAEIRDRAQRGRIARPLRIVLALFQGLGIALPAAAGHAAVPGGAEYRRLGRDLETLFENGAEVEPGRLAKLRREWLLAAEPGVALRRNLRRLGGLIRPGTGLPNV